MTIVSCGRLALVVAWSLTSLGVASAADIPAKAPVYNTQITEAVSNWSGFYVGAGLGFRSSQTDVNVNSARNTGNPAVLVDQFLAADCLAGLPCVRGQQFNGTAFRASPYLGYNWQMNSRWVLGIEADAGF